jgi:hypothetical protein
MAHRSPMHEHISPMLLREVRDHWGIMSRELIVGTVCSDLMQIRTKDHLLLICLFTSQRSIPVNVQPPKALVVDENEPIRQLLCAVPEEESVLLLRARMGRGPFSVFAGCSPP